MEQAVANLGADPAADPALTAAPSSKNPWIAFGASAVLPGLGQFYGDRPMSGALFLGLEGITVGTYLYLKSEGDSRETDFMRYAQKTAGAAAKAPDSGHDFDKYYEDLIKEESLWSGDYYGDSYLRVVGGGSDPIPYTGDATGFFDWQPLPGEDISILAQEADFLEYYEPFDTQVLQPIMSENQKESYNQNAWIDAARSHLPPNRDFSGELSDFFYDQEPIVSNENIKGAYDEYRIRAYGGEWAWNWAHPDEKSARPVGSARDLAEQNLAEYKRLRGRSNDAFKQATFVGGLAIFNHVIASVHAGKGAALKNREHLAALPGGARLGLGVNPDTRNPAVEVRLSRAF